MNFSDALTQLKDGAPVQRESWNPDQQLQVQIVDSKSKMTEPYLYLNIGLETGESQRVPYIPTFGDLFAEDWKIAD